MNIHQGVEQADPLAPQSQLLVSTGTVKLTEGGEHFELTIHRAELVLESQGDSRCSTIEDPTLGVVQAEGVFEVTRPGHRLPQLGIRLGRWSGIPDGRRTRSESESEYERGGEGQPDQTTALEVSPAATAHEGCTGFQESTP